MTFKEAKALAWVLTKASGRRHFICQTSAAPTFYVTTDRAEAVRLPR